MTKLRQNSFDSKILVSSEYSHKTTQYFISTQVLCRTPTCTALVVLVIVFEVLLHTSISSGPFSGSLIPKHHPG